MLDWIQFNSAIFDHAAIESASKVCWNLVDFSFFRPKFNLEAPKKLIQSSLESNQVGQTDRNSASLSLNKMNRV